MEDVDVISFDVPRGLGETVTTVILTFLVGKFHKPCFSTVAGRGGITIFLFFNICVLYFVYIYIYMLYLYLLFCYKGGGKHVSPENFGKTCLQCFQRGNSKLDMWWLCWYVGLSHLPLTVANEVLQGFPTKHVIIINMYLPGPSSLGAKWFLKQSVVLNHPLHSNWHPNWKVLVCIE